MRGAGSHWRIGRQPSQALLGWIFATFLVAVALFGPPLTGQSIPALVGIRHDISMIDREFERWSIGTDTSLSGTSTAVQNDLGRAASARTKTPLPGGLL
jgi:hypothetical protein